MMKRFFICLVLVMASCGLAWSENAPMVFDRDTEYDIYFSGNGQGAYVMRRVKIIESGTMGEDGYLVVKANRPVLKDASGRGFVFMKGIYSIVPSDSFRVENVN